MLTTKNLANFTKSRPSLRVIGTPNLNATRSEAQQSERQSVFSSQKSRFSMKRKYETASKGEVRVRLTRGAEQHKKRILDVVNRLTEEELEKVSEMLRASDTLAEPVAPEGG